MLFFADHHLNAVFLKIGERFVRVLQRVLPPRGGRGSHRRREIDQPFRADGKARHHLQRRRRPLLGDGERAVQAGGK